MGNKSSNAQAIWVVGVISQIGQKEQIHFQLVTSSIDDQVSCSTLTALIRIGLMYLINLSLYLCMIRRHTTLRYNRSGPSSTWKDWRQRTGRVLFLPWSGGTLGRWKRYPRKRHLCASRSPPLYLENRNKTCYITVVVPLVIFLF